MYWVSPWAQHVHGPSPGSERLQEVARLQLEAQALLLTELDPQLQGLVRRGWGLPETGRSPGAGQGDAPWW